MRASHEDESSKHGGTDPWEVFTRLVALVVEGRTPGGDKGYHAGPHCFRPQQPIGHRHECNLSSTICWKADMLLKQLRLMWEVGVGVGVEVLLAPDCQHGVDIANTLDTTSAPHPTAKLLEQWNFTIYDRRMPNAISSSWALVAAVRSYLHFSQLSAWLSSSGGSGPPNVLYGLAVTSPMFCSKFEGISEVHSFPMATIGTETSMKVVVRTLPRTDKIPNIICEEQHNIASSRDSISDDSSRSELTLERYVRDSMPANVLDTTVSDQVHRTDEDLRRSMMKAKLTDAVFVRRSESPDTQLGESLLDPPNSMSRIPRRFQSPSRSGSPSLETPEHLLCNLRQSGPSHARPPGTVPFCQPLVIPARQPLNPFPWTRTCYPSFNHNANHYQESYIPKAFNVTPEKLAFQQPSYSGANFDQNFHFTLQDSNSSACIRPSPQYLRRSQSPYEKDPRDQPRVDSVFGPKMHTRDGPIAGSSKEPWESFRSLHEQDNNLDKSCGLSAMWDMDCDNVPSAFTNSASRPIKTAEASQGTKRKGIHKIESPKKRESPPHCSKLEECTSSSASLFSKDLLLWPHSSLPGKHPCPGAEHISDMCNTATVDIMPKTSQMQASRAGGLPKLFDLTPKETKEILDVLRQSTPVPPLRINRTEVDHPATEFVFGTKSKMSKYAQQAEQKIKWKNVNVNNSSKLNTTVSAPTNILKAPASDKELHFIKPHQYSEPSTSANYSCDTSIKQPLDSPQSLSLPSCSSGVKRKLLNDLQDSAKSFTDVVTTCIQAKTVKEKTNSFTAISQAARSPRHVSVVLGRRPDSSMSMGTKRSSPIAFEHDHEEESPKAKRSFVDPDVKQDDQLCDSRNVDRENEANEFKKGDRETYGGANVDRETDQYYVKNESINVDVGKGQYYLKGDNLLKRIIKPTNLSLSRFSDRGRSCDEYKSEEELDKGNDLISNKENLNGLEDVEVEDICRSKCVPIPSASDKVNFRRSFDSATNLVFHNKTGLPLTSSPAPMRKGNSFDYDSSLISVAAIKCALRSCDNEENDTMIAVRSPSETAFKPVISLSAPATVTCSNLLGNFEESVLNGRLEPFSTVHGFKAEIAASGSFCPKHVTKPVTVFFYTLCDNYQMSSPYMGHVDLGKKGYQVPNKGTVQVTLFNPHGTVVKMFVVMYNLADMPPNSKTFLRQRTLNMPVGETDSHPNAHQWLRYLIHLRFASSRSGKIYLHTDLRMMIFRKADVDAALLHQTDVPYEVRSFTHGPTNPRFSPRK